MFGLYGDLPQAKSNAVEAEATPWFPSKLKPALKRPLPSESPQADLKPAPRVLRNSARFQSDQGQSTTSSSVVVVRENENDYDPGRPNDYEEVRKAREVQRKEAELEVGRQELLKLEARRQEEIELDTRYDISMSAGSAAQPNLNISGEEAFLQRARLSNRGGAPTGTSTESKDPKGLSLAARMMEKMGWKEGQGLGRSKQGIVTPLIAQKTDARSGVIVNASSSTAHQDKRPRVGTSLQGAPSRVILLRNMVGPGEVDDELEDEIGVECSKFGNVQSVLIFEVTEPGFPAEETVRIFVEFDREEAATKAVVDLGGRFFGGRTVQATFFDIGKFQRHDLAPSAEELAAIR
ncbi:Splicing factor 45 [Coccomyxa sp. Obi]|nr:Splicing factor 45 [Coccomyxa sp. Obi]